MKFACFYFLYDVFYEKVPTRIFIFFLLFFLKGILDVENRDEWGFKIKVANPK
jgi:hypothetical protein